MIFLKNCVELYTLKINIIHIPNLALFFIASERLVLALLASLFDLKQNSKMAMNMATTNNAAREKKYITIFIFW